MKKYILPILTLAIALIIVGTNVAKSYSGEAETIIKNINISKVIINVLNNGVKIEEIEYSPGPIKDFKVGAYGDTDLINLILSGDLDVDGDTNLVGLDISSDLDVTGTTTIDGNLTVDTNTLYVDNVNNRVGIGTTSPIYELDVNGTVRTLDNLLVGNTTGEAGFIGSGDIFASDSIKANGGFYAETQPYGAGLEILNNGNVNIYTNVIYRDATLTASTQTITDTHASYDDSYIGDFLLVFSSTPSYTGAVGEITDVLDSTHLVLSFATSNGDTIVDAIAMSYVIYERPIFFAGDNGYVTATIGNSPDAEFKIDIPEGNGFTGVFIDDVAGIDQHQALTVDVDAQGYDGIVGLNLFMQNSSTTNPSVGVTEIMASFEGDGTNYSSSELRFMDFNLLGSGAGNDVDIMHINGLPLTGHIIHSGSPELLLAGYYDDGAGTTASTTTAFNSEDTNVTLFENDNSIIYIAGATSSEFTNIAFSLLTEGRRNINAEYYYCDGDDSWKILPGAVDTTDGLKTSGSINFPNPVDRGLCNEEIDSTAFPDTELRPYIAIKRTRNAYPGQKPIESLVTISGGTDYLYMDSYGLKPVPSAGAPYACTYVEAGMQYYDSSDTHFYGCNATSWVQLDN